MVFTVITALKDVEDKFVEWLDHPSTGNNVEEFWDFVGEIVEAAKAEGAAAERARMAVGFQHVNTCEAAVARQGQMDACGKPAVALTAYALEGDENPWPVCAWHANHLGECLSLAEVMGIAARGQVPVPADEIEGADRG